MNWDTNIGRCEEYQDLEDADRGWASASHSNNPDRVDRNQYLVYATIRDEEGNKRTVEVDVTDQLGLSSSEAVDKIGVDSHYIPRCSVCSDGWHQDCGKFDSCILRLAGEVTT
jgi:hypothetical protein